jgi:hypothetical protein
MIDFLLKKELKKRKNYLLYVPMCSTKKTIIF